MYKVFDAAMKLVLTFNAFDFPHIYVYNQTIEENIFIHSLCGKRRGNFLSMLIQI